GRRFAFAALVIVGDQKGRAGYGHGKAREVPEAIRKATDAAKRSLTRVPLRAGARPAALSKSPRCSRAAAKAMLNPRRIKDHANGWGTKDHQGRAGGEPIAAP